MEKRARLAPGTIAMAVGGVAAALFYGWFLSVYLVPMLPGDAAFGQAVEALTALALLWLALVVLVVMDRAFGGASWTRRAGFVLIPVAAVAMTFGTDYPSNMICQAGVVGMPAAVGAYVLLGRLPARQAALAQAAVLAVIAAWSAYAIRLFLS